MQTTKIRDAGKAREAVEQPIARKTSKPANRKPGAWKGKIRIGRDFERADRDIESLFYQGPIEPPACPACSRILA